ncbi:MAG: hypothetical protein JWP25_5654 [Bradyrhizobium sp.]|jgi:hypothetical protein|nr:hypothetical protein [Bradyrhizobium sp.]MEA2867821.1 hypothetical protein [Bradyrhizobium sp.]
MVGREFCFGRARVLSRYKYYARDRATRRAGWRRNSLHRWLESIGLEPASYGTHCSSHVTNVISRDRSQQSG